MLIFVFLMNFFFPLRAIIYICQHNAQINFFKALVNRQAYFCLRNHHTYMLNQSRKNIKLSLSWNMNVFFKTKRNFFSNFVESILSIIIMCEWRTARASILFLFDIVWSITSNCWHQAKKIKWKVYLKRICVL